MKNISIRDKIFFSILLSFFIAIIIVIIQYNSISSIEKYTNYLKVLTTLNKHISNMQNDYSKLNVELIKIVSTKKKDEFLKSKNIYINIKNSIKSDYNQFNQLDFNDISIDENKIQELFLIQDSINTYFNNYNNKIVLISDKIVELKTLILNPNKISDNYKLLLADQLKLGNIESNYNIDFHTEQETVNKLLDIYNYTIEYQNKFLNKSLRNQDIYFNNILNSINIMIDKASNDLIEKRKKAVNNSIILFLVGLFIAIGLSYWLSHNISNSLFKFSDIFDRINNGEIVLESGIDSSNEIGYIVSSMDEFLKYLNESVKFSQEIVKGNFKYFYQPLNENDILGNSLIQLQEYLKQAKQEENKREIEDSKRRRESDAVSLFAEILRQTQNNIQNLGKMIISNIVKFFNANQGMFFIVKDTNEEEKVLELVSTYAWNREKYFQKRIKIGDGLIGSVAAEKFTVYMTDVPEDFIEIKSGTGGANPTSILLVPIKTEDEVLGVIEVASFKEFESYEIQIIENIANDIASTLKSVKVSQQTSELLEKFQIQAEEMTLQENELKETIKGLTANLEEKNKIEEDLKKRIKEIDEQNRQIQYKDEQLKKELIRLQENLKQIQSEKSVSLEMIKEIVSNLKYGLIAIDKRDKVFEINEKTILLTEYSEEELKSEDLSKILIEPVGYNNNGYFNFFTNKMNLINEENGWEVFLIKKSGTNQKVTIRIIKLLVKDKEILFLIISDNKEIEENIEKSQENLNKIYENYFYTTLENEEYITLLKENNIPIPKLDKENTEIIKWGPKYNLGISLIDNQHKKWFEYINKFFNALIHNEESKINDLLTALINYTEYHFGFEERYFEEFDYNAKSQHKEKHIYFIDNLNKTATDFIKGNNVSVYKLLIELVHWVNNHVLLDDKAYSELFKKHGLK